MHATCVARQFAKDSGLEQLKEKDLLLSNSVKPKANRKLKRICRLMEKDIA